MEKCDSGFTPFNHGYLCQMLRSASNEELNNIFNDIEKEKKRRQTVEKEMLTAKIHNAINDAVNAGYNVEFYCYNGNEPDLVIHENNTILMGIDLK